MNRPVVAAVLAVLVTLSLGCGDDGGRDDSTSPSTTDGSTSSGGGGAVDPASLESYDDLEALRTAIADAGWTCELEYEGLEEADKTLSICVIDGEQATLTIWRDTADITALVGAELGLELVAYGSNWTIDVASADRARALANALGGASGSAS